MKELILKELAQWRKLSLRVKVGIVIVLLSLLTISALFVSFVSWLLYNLFVTELVSWYVKAGILAVCGLFIGVPLATD